MRDAPRRTRSMQSQGARRHDVRLDGPQAPSSSSPEVPNSLREFADEEGLPEADLSMLASIRFLSEQPRTKERWRYIYTAIATSRAIDTAKPRQVFRTGEKLHSPRHPPAQVNDSIDTEPAGYVMISAMMMDVGLRPDARAARCPPGAKGRPCLSVTLTGSACSRSMPKLFLPPNSTSHTRGIDGSPTVKCPTGTASLPR